MKTPTKQFSFLVVFFTVRTALLIWVKTPTKQFSFLVVFFTVRTALLIWVKTPTKQFSFLVVFFTVRTALLIWVKTPTKNLVFQDCPKTQIFFQAARSIEGCKCLLKSFVLSFVVSLFSCALVTVKMECHKPIVFAFPICSKSDVMLNKWAMTLTSCSKIPFYHALFICRSCQALILAKYFWISVSRCFFF